MSYYNTPTGERYTEAKARRDGYEITRGALTGETDDRAGRWYVERLDADEVDRRGPGYRTKAEALAAAWQEAEQEAYRRNLIEGAKMVREGADDE